MIGHLLYEDNEFENQTLDFIFKEVGKLAFEVPPPAKSGAQLPSSGSAGD